MKKNGLILTFGAIGLFVALAVMSWQTRPVAAVELQDAGTMSPQSCATDVFFSEYIEGSSNNKAIEIYNGTGSAIDLDAGDYEVELYSNGGMTVQNMLDLSGTIAAGDVYVIANPSADTAILNESDITSDVTFYNGNDVLLLRQGGTVIDAIGQLGDDPGSDGWGSGDTTTSEHTLVRQYTIFMGDGDESDAFDPADEWDGFAQNTFGNLGWHQIACGAANHVTISDIQFTTDPSGDSPLAGQVISTTGTVYGVYPLGFGLADAEGEWNGIYVFTEVAPTVQQGDKIEIEGLVDEFFGRSTIGNDVDNPTITVLSVGNAPYPASVVTTGEIATGGSSAENYEGVLVEVQDVTVSNENPDDPSDFGEWEVDDSSGGVRVDDLTYAYEPTLNEELDYVRGMLYYSFSNTKIEPRDAMDVGSGNGGGDLVCGDPATPIYAVQGDGDISPILGETDIEIEGVVVGDFQDTTNELSGFFLQEEDADSDGLPLTSDAVFVFDNGLGVDVAVGDVVRVQGDVDEFFEMTQVDNVDDVTICASEQGGLVSVTPIMPPVGAVGDYERWEAMWVTFTDVLFVTEHFNIGRFGELSLSAENRLYNPTQIAEPGTPANDQQAENDRHRILLDDGSRVQNPATVPYLGDDNTIRGGDTVSGLTGVIDYAFGAYRLQPTEMVSITRANDREDVPADVGGRLQVASFNVLNYFTTIDDSGSICGPAGDQGCRGADSEEEFTRQRTKIIEALTLINADVFGLIEIENHANDDAVADLVAGLNDQLGAGTYAAVETGTIGTDAIKVALIYKTATVSPSGAFAVLDSSVDPLFNDEKNRPVLAQTFSENGTGQLFTVAVNHLKSKGSSCDDVGDPDTGDGQGNCNITRTNAATAMVNWLAADPTASGDSDFFIMGDLNAYAMEDPIDALRAGNYTDLAEEFIGEGRYSYVFDGQWGTLDYALASPTALEQVTGATVWHINADEPRVLDYNTEFNPPGLYTPDTFRASDHDPVIFGLVLEDPTAIELTNTKVVTEREGITAFLILCSLLIAYLSVRTIFRLTNKGN